MQVDLTPHELLSDEAARLQALHDYQVLDTDAEDEFDDFTALAAHICGTPVALISLIDSDRQWFKSRRGMTVRETPRHVAFCDHAIRQEGVFVVPDAPADARFADNPLVTGDTGIQFYAGAPLVTSDGHALGSLCVIDHHPRTLSSEQETALSALSRQVVARLELRRQMAERAKAEEALHVREEALRVSEARKAAILASALDCIITMDAAGRVVEWNPAAEATFGYPASESVGRDLASLIVPPALRESHRRGLAHYLATGEGPILNRRIEVPALRADGTEFPVELAVVPVPLSGRTLFVAYLRDLTERERLAAQQRAFLRDVLLSVTEGRLHLCHSPADLPAPLSPFGGPVSLTREGGLRELRLLSMDAAAGMSDEVKHDLVTAVSEAGMNAVVHAGGGTGQVSVGEGGTVQVRVEDHGAGIDTANLPRATLARGFSTKATLGHGLKLMLETADHLYLLTGPEGTTVVLEQERERPLPAWL